MRSVSVLCLHLILLLFVCMMSYTSFSRVWLVLGWLTWLVDGGWREGGV